MGKNKKKSKLGDEFFSSLVENKAKPPAAKTGTHGEDDGWSTGPASMMLDDDEHGLGGGGGGASAEVAAAAKGQPGDAGTRTVGMSVDKPAAKGLGVSKANLKRGQRTRTQQIRKSSKVEKAFAHVDKIGNRVEGRQSKKTRKLTLKHMY